MASRFPPAFFPKNPVPGVDFAAVLRRPWTQFNCIKQARGKSAVAADWVYFDSTQNENPLFGPGDLF
jgi:hypothetical protein